MYTTMNRPDAAQKNGFFGGKFTLPYGPADGEAGLQKNFEVAKAHRDAVGPDFNLMIDCWMSLNPRYTIDLAHRLEPLNIRWLEECLLPDDYDGWIEIKKHVHHTMMTTGEHEYTRFGFKKLLDTRSVDVLQPDITWCGGMTEALRIVSLASAYDIPVVPHGSGPYSYHLQISHTNCPIGELINLSPGGDKIVPIFGGLFTGEVLPKDGYIDVPNRPGFGMELVKTNLIRPYLRKGAKLLRNIIK